MLLPLQRHLIARTRRWSAAIRLNSHSDAMVDLAGAAAASNPVGSNSISHPKLRHAALTVISEFPSVLVCVLPAPWSARACFESCRNWRSNLIPIITRIEMQILMHADCSPTQCMRPRAKIYKRNRQSVAKVPFSLPMINSDWVLTGRA